MTDPVTVPITRIVNPAHEEQMMAWLRAGAELADSTALHAREGARRRCRPGPHAR